MEDVCPKCAARVTLAETSGPRTCLSCGQPLETKAVTDPCVADAGLALLSAEIREAFGSGAYEALRPEEVARAYASGRHAADAEPEPALIGARLGDFELLGELGRGGMGIVYRARQTSLNREVALKVLPSLAWRNRASVARFCRESQAAARLHHTNIVPIYAQGEHQGRFYYAMELIEGESLDSALRCDSSVAGLTPRPVTPPSGFPRSSGQGPGAVAEEGASRLEVSSIPRTRQDYRRIARLLAEVADGLAHAHRHGVIHRDVKPHNLLLGQDHRLHITDFGLAHLLDEPHLTLSGEVMGTPAYMSPEQVAGRRTEIDHRTDIYSLGVTLYELLTLRRPFEGRTREQIIHSICSAEPRPPRRLDPRIPLDLQTVCLRAMVKEPAGRYSTAAALAEDLRRFADDRPILTRRANWVTKALKWSRRHKAASTAIVAIGLAGVMTATWASGALASRHQEAARLTEKAYAELVYYDYHHPERVSDDLDQAEQLGGNARRLELIHALMAMGGADPDEAVGHLEALVRQKADEVETLYLLAWAYWRSQEHDLSRATFERAESLGGAQTAAEWFFRGLASQFADPSRAIASYEGARALRAKQSEFFPQATLHLARARNQEMYRTRRIEVFAEVEQALNELIVQKVYGAYPCYLLSIAHRLAAEIYAGSEGTRPDTAEYHYAEALRWARTGQELAEPGNDRPLTAEAECHESMGHFAEAIIARTAAIETASHPEKQWEGYHYRWRLYYWTGQLEEALADLRILHEQFDSDSVFYSYAYPMLVLTEAGRMDDALTLARAVAEPEGGSAPSSALLVLWSATCLRLLGHPAEADRLLADRADRVDYAAGLVAPQSADWIIALYSNAVGMTPFEALLERAGQADDPSRLTGEAYFHAAAAKLASGDREGALHDFDEAYRSFDEEKRYTYHAKILRTRLTHDPTWPAWTGPPAKDLQENGRD
ncbi:MAG: protein kinase [Planctomycetota bacterium]